MERFTIKDIENLCQIKAHTLRIWEQRYDFFKAQRKESQHRFYDSEDLRVLLQVAFLYHGGWKISRIAELTPAQRIDQISAVREQGGLAEQEVLALVEAAATFDESTFRQQLNRLVEQKGLERAILEIAFPFLQRVGHLWLTRHVIPAQEHFSSYLLQHKIISETDRLPNQQSRFPGILVVTPVGEHHELPLLFINYLLRKYGWPVTYLGPNMDVAALPAYLLERCPVIYLHLITNLTGETADELLERISTAHPGKKIVASGGAIRSVQRNFLNIVLLRNDADILRFVRQGLPG